MKKALLLFPSFRNFIFAQEPAAFSSLKEKVVYTHKQDFERTLLRDVTRWSRD